MRVYIYRSLLYFTSEPGGHHYTTRGRARGETYMNRARVRTTSGGVVVNTPSGPNSLSICRVPRVDLRFAHCVDTMNANGRVSVAVAATRRKRRAEKGRRVFRIGMGTKGRRTIRAPEMPLRWARRLTAVCVELANPAYCDDWIHRWLHRTPKYTHDHPMVRAVHTHPPRGDHIDNHSSPAWHRATAWRHEAHRLATDFYFTNGGDVDGGVDFTYGYRLQPHRRRSTGRIYDASYTMWW